MTRCVARNLFRAKLLLSVRNKFRSTLFVRDGFE